MTTLQDRPSNFDFSAAITQLFTQAGGRDFAVRLVLWMAVFMTIGFAIMAKTMLGFMGDTIQASWVVNKNSGDVDAALQIYAGMLQYLPGYFLSMLLMWAVYASAETALHKRIFHGVDHGFIPLRFGRDELRVMGVQLVVYLMVLGVMFAGMLIAVILIVLAEATGQLTVILAFLFGAMAFIVYIGAFVYMAYFSVRMAPSAALSIATNETRFTGGWSITKKRTGSLFLAYLFIFIAGYIVVTIIQMTMFSVVFSENYMMVVMGLSEQNPEVLFKEAAEKIKNPGTMITLIIGGLLYILVTCIWWLSIVGVSDYAVQWWQKDNLGEDN
jgi:hypothetical protein